MKKELILTKDGSHSLYVPLLNETYHSVHGAVAEAQHVFIKNGLQAHNKTVLSILEIGFGTGLNALLTYENLAEKKIHYTSLEPFPIIEAIFAQLNYHQFCNSEKSVFLALHEANWEKEVPINANFILQKSTKTIQTLQSITKYDIIYFDAFAPEKQPEMWEKEVLEKCFHLLNQNGFLVSYCAKGIVKRTLKEIGFKLETLQGPPGKREMIRAWR